MKEVSPSGAIHGLGGAPAPVGAVSSAPLASAPLSSAPLSASPAPTAVPAGPFDKAATPVWLAHNTGAVADAIREAGSARVALRVRAGGGWLDAGRPVTNATHVLDVGALRGIVEYTPGDLTLTARAGTTLAEIDDATRPHGQWLPLDPHGAPADTLGATLATASCGPLGASLGLPRDLALGVEFVDGRGTVVRGGGRVVKNVAGFDLVRLTVGAWGTLGVITEATVRLRARPDHCATLAVEAPGDQHALARLLRALREGPLTPIATELLDATLSAALGATAGDADAVVIRLVGNATSVAAQRRHVMSLARTVELPDTVWDALRRVLPAGAASVRVSHRPERLAVLWHDLATRTRDIPGCLRHATVERGVARCAVPAGHAEALTEVLPALVSSWRVVGEVLAPSAWSVLQPAGSDRLSRGVRAAFDELHLLNPGLMDATT
ncbi:MAG: FAD-binding oxidoreductase [Gemmatimonadetes bacterium]|nr:FAD-binding oxidoreductase [Gemmatimonadota bacterium]